MRTFNYTSWNPVHVSVFESVSGQAWTQLNYNVPELGI
jgi:hypothetical protein